MREMERPCTYNYSQQGCLSACTVHPPVTFQIQFAERIPACMQGLSWHAPVMTKMPAPMMAPMPRHMSWNHPSVFFISAQAQTHALVLHHGDGPKLNCLGVLASPTPNPQRVLRYVGVGCWPKLPIYAELEFLPQIERSFVALSWALAFREMLRTIRSCCICRFCMGSGTAPVRSTPCCTCFCLNSDEHIETSKETAPQPCDAEQLPRLNSK
jgi:hypothetical protein